MEEGAFVLGLFGVLWIIFATVDPTKILPQTPAGWAGWGTAIPVSTVVAWLILKHIPGLNAQIASLIKTNDEAIRDVLNKSDAKLEAKDSLIRELVTVHGQKIEALTLAYRQESKEMGEVFKSSLVSVQAHCEQEVSKIVEGVNRTLEGMRSEFKMLSRQERQERSKA